ncbi:protein phosphatase 2C 51-like [Zingiber officinale]|uniref:protein phosphatase 2C 51-like n=1 Tax=Zingiber officinale TaxID=94328 RepID=UPI001C4C0D65|nr:protein phosphatase 2C 51-like [Zingiber officinale]
MAGADEIHSKAGGAVGFSQENETVSILLKKPSSARGRRIGLRRGRSVGLEVKRSMDSPEEGSNSSPTSDRDADEGIFGIMAGGGEIRVREGQGTRLPCLSHGAVSLIGRRREMEDAVAVVPGFIGGGGPSEYDFFGVYDGHGGARVAQLCRERLHVVLAEEASAVGWPRAEGRWREVMSASFSRVDGEAEATAQAESERTMGSTAVVAVVGTKRIVVANCGDSRAVLCRGGAALPLSFDHKADRPDEMARVEAAGGRVINWEGYRVLGVLATSRSIGDYYLKPFVISEPDVTVTERTDKDEFLILASDGLWDVVSNEAACKIARQCLNGRMARMFPDAVGGSTATEAAALLAQLAVSRESEDNISVVVVQLKPLHARTSWCSN